MAGYKYALMVMPTSHASGDDSLHQLPGNMITWCGKLVDFVEQENVQDWKTWLGTMVWHQFAESKQRFVFFGKKSPRPDIDDRESVNFRDRLQSAWTALLLTDSTYLTPDINGSTVRVVSGEAASLAPIPRLKRIRHLGTYAVLPWPNYRRSKAYNHAHFALASRHLDDHWIEVWRANLDIALAVRQAFPELLAAAIRSYTLGLSHSRMDFRLPAFVRAAEGVLAVPKPAVGASGGSQQFAERCLRIAPWLSLHWYVGGPRIAEQLEKLYEHRNECVHGALPFPDIYDQNKRVVALEAGRKFEFLAELIARECLLAGLRHPKFMRNRDFLQKSWASRQFPKP